MAVRICSSRANRGRTWGDLDHAVFCFQWAVSRAHLIALWGMDAHVVSTLLISSGRSKSLSGPFTVINASHSMSTSHPPNAYTSAYNHQLASHPHHQQPQSSYQRQSHPNHHLPGPVQIVRSDSRDSASSGQPSPNRDGRDPYANRERREVWDGRVDRKTRPATIAELADKSREDLWDPNKHLKHWLRTAELARKSGKQLAESGDYERSFVQLARAATIILEKMPTHKDYHTLLTSNQRNNLVLVSPLSAAPFIPLHRLCCFRLPLPFPVISLVSTSSDLFNFDA